ncbi:MAG: serine/threonine protein kinase [Myxococcota bacterium]|jgi:serine/threonine protein kinase
MNTLMRICPQCGTETTAMSCRNDGFGTVDASRYRRYDPSSLIGTLFQDRYRVDAVLGSGGMGSVYRATQIRVGRQVALKVINATLAYDLSVVARFQREGRAIAALIHPNIVQVYDFGQSDDGQLFMAMELVEGKTLADLIREDAPLEPSRAHHIGSQIFDALAEAHEHGVIHRDLKPDNIFMTSTGRRRDVVKILDFGIAKIVNEPTSESMVTSRGAILGSPRYMAPEQARGKGVTGHADIYAVGGIIHEMLTGRPVFSEPSPADYVVAHSVKMPPPPSANGVALHGPLVDLVMRCLEKKPWNRPDGAARVLEALEACRLSPVIEAGDNAPVRIGRIPTDQDAAPRRLVKSSLTAKTYTGLPALPGGDVSVARVEPSDLTASESAEGFPPPLPDRPSVMEPLPLAKSDGGNATAAANIAMLADDDTGRSTALLIRGRGGNSEPPMAVASITAGRKAPAAVSTRPVGAREGVGQARALGTPPGAYPQDAPTRNFEPPPAQTATPKEDDNHSGGGLLLLAATILLAAGAVIYFAANGFFQTPSTAPGQQIARTAEPATGNVGPARAGNVGHDPVLAGDRVTPRSIVGSQGDIAPSARAAGAGVIAAPHDSKRAPSALAAQDKPSVTEVGVDAPNSLHAAVVAADPSLTNGAESAKPIDMVEPVPREVKDTAPLKSVAAVVERAPSVRTKSAAQVAAEVAERRSLRAERVARRAVAREAAAKRAVAKKAAALVREEAQAEAEAKAPTANDIIKRAKPAKHAGLAAASPSRISLTADPFANKAVKPWTRAVTVGSTPAGASIYLGRQRLGVTPLTIEVEDSGQPIMLLVEKDGYRRYRMRLPKGGAVDVFLVPEATDTTEIDASGK